MSLGAPHPSSAGPAAGVAGEGAGRRSWLTARGLLPLDRPRTMGILNVTPDSFWDGGRHSGLDTALRQAETLLEQGADLIDVGGESTRPGAEPVPEADEAARVVPVVEGIARRWPDALVSVDTVKSGIAAAALDAGAAVINDVSGLRLDADMAGTCARGGAGVVLMHSRGTVDQMASYATAIYGDDPTAEICRELASSADRAREAGLSYEAVVLDPGLGFSKRTHHSVGVLRELDRVLELGYPVLVGPSRKRFVGELAGDVPAEQRLPGTIAACVAAWHAGARLFRVHDVGPVRQALSVAAALHPGHEPLPTPVEAS